MTLVSTSLFLYSKPIWRILASEHYKIFPRTIERFKTLHGVKYSVYCIRKNDNNEMYITMYVIIPSCTVAKSVLLLFNESGKKYNMPQL
jgi:hypothetical protein